MTPHPSLPAPIDRRRFVRHAAAGWGLALTVAALSGCGTTYDTRFYYQPRPAITEVDRADGTAAARVVTSIVGLRHADEEAGLPRSVELRLRLENEGVSPLRFDPESLRMYGGDAEPLGDPIVEPGNAIELAPDGTATVRAFFPYDEDLDDVSDLALRWSVQIDEDELAGTAHFSRRVRPSYRSHHPYHHHRFGFGLGFHRGYCY